MEELLKDVSAVVGVTGSFVCDEEGRIVARVLPTVFDEAILSTVGRTVMQTFAGLETARRRRVQDLDLVYGEGRLVAKNLKRGCLCILCVRNINLPLLNLTANLAAKKLSESLKGVAEEVVPKRAVVLVEERAREEAVPTLQEETLQILTAARERGVLLRGLGSVAVLLHCASAGRITSPFTQKELNFATYGRERGDVGKLLESLGYEPNQRFNALQGHKRLRFFHPGKEIQIHIFVDNFEMYHRLPFANRLHLDESTIPLADLLLTKLQVVEISEEELREVYALVYDHELGDKADPEKIDMAPILELCADDWGWYKTVTVNIEKSLALAGSFLGQEEKELYSRRIGRLRQMIEGAPKSMRWQLRARRGEGSRWYEVPEELG